MRENCEDSNRYKRFGKRDLHGTTEGKLQQCILRSSLRAVGQMKLAKIIRTASVSSCLPAV